MTSSSPRDLSRRERQILDILYARQSATAVEVQEALPDAPSNSTVRTLLRLLEEKGVVKHESDGPRFVYSPVVRRDRARTSALKHLLKTFFDDSPREVVNALLDVSKSRMSDEELREIAKLVRRAKEEGK